MPVYRLVNDTHVDISVKFDHDTESELTRAGASAKTLVDKEVSVLLRNIWSEWPVKRIMMSRYGLFQIVLECKITTKTPVTEILRMVLRLKEEFDIPSLLRRKTEELRAKKADVEIELNDLGKLYPEKSGASTIHDLPHWVVLTDQIDELEHKIDEYRELASQLTNSLNNTLDPTVQWEIVRIMVESFIKNFAGLIETTGPEGKSSEIRFTENPLTAFTTGVSYPLRYGHTLFEFSALTWEGDGRSVPAGIHEPKTRSELASLLEAVQLVDPANQVVTWPATKEVVANELFSRDISTWDKELCIFTGDNSLMYHPYPGDALTLGPSFPRRVRYKEYWSSVGRGLAYIAELRTVAKLLQNETSDDIEDTAEYRHRLLARNPHRIREDMKDIGIRFTSASMLIARLRNATMPTTMSSADYSIAKFSALTEIFQIDEMVRHSQRNADLLNSLLSHYDDMLSNKTNLLMTAVLSLVTVALPILALPPYIRYITNDDAAPREWLSFWFSESLRNGAIDLMVTFGIILAMIVFVFGLVGVFYSLLVLFWVPKTRRYQNPIESTDDDSHN
jgi:hypothetical protein